MRVLDLTSQLSGPYCTMLLADLGADVIKVERPGAGDDVRAMSPRVAGESAPFMMWNRNKRSLALDLKAPEGRQIALRLADRADILVENFRPGTVDRLGLGWETVSARNPRLLYCSISGFGQTGPYAGRGGFDRIAQGMSGLMSINGEEEGPPLPVPIPVADIGAGMFAAIGILAALQSRQATGRGQRVDTSLLETPIAWSVYEAANFFATGEVPQRMGQGHRASAPYQAFRTRDGWLNIGGGSPGFWPKICAVLDLDHLVADARFAAPADRVANRKVLAALIEERLASESTTHWLERFDADGIPVGPILGYDEVFADPHVRERQMIVEVEHPRAGRSRVLGVPVKLSDTPGTIRRAAPTLGQHTREVLTELGLDLSEIARLEAAGVIQAEDAPPA